MTDPVEITTIVMDATARICSEAFGEGHVFAAGMTEDVTEADPFVVPLADDMPDTGASFCYVTLGKWDPVLHPGHIRETIMCQGAVWRRRVPLGDNVNALYGDRDRLIRAFAAHARGFELVDATASVILMGGPGIKPRAMPRRGADASTGLYLTLPFRVEWKVQYVLRAQPA